MSLSKLWEMVKNSKSWQAAVHGVAEPDVVELLEHQRLTTFPRPKRHVVLAPPLSFWNSSTEVKCYFPSYST